MLYQGDPCLLHQISAETAKLGLVIVFSDCGNQIRGVKIAEASPAIK